MRLAIPVSVVLLSVSLTAADWPQWRGPQASGIAPDQTLPLRWSATENIAWTAQLAGLGISTPIIAGDRVFVTSQVGAGVRRPGNHPRLVQSGDAAAAGERALGADRGAAPSERTEFVVEAFGRTDGRRLWEHRIAAEGPLPEVHDKHNLASPSPVTDGGLVFAWFGTGQLVALEADTGNVAWQRHLGREISPFDVQWGHTSSPVLHGSLLILLCDHPGVSYLLALDKMTGKERWKADRGKGRSSYSTPVVVAADGHAEVVVNSSDRVDGYDAATGELLWHFGEPNRFPIPAAVVHGGVIYMSRGYRSGPYFAIRPGGRGALPSSHVLWHVPTGAPYVSSLLYFDRRIYMANDVGVLTAADAASGERIWQERVEGVFSASPVAGAGHVFFAAEGGTTFVVKAGAKPEIVARNDLGQRIIASPAIAGGRIFLRTDDHVVSIGR